MKFLFKIFTCSIILIGLTTLAGCEKNNDLSQDQQAINSLSDDELVLVSMEELATISNIKDPQIIAELDWLWRHRYFDAKKSFCDAHRNGISFWELGKEEYGYSVDTLYVIPGMHESDMLTTRRFVQQELTKERMDKYARHYRQSTMFTGGTVTVRILNSVPLQWRNAIATACTEWNNLGSGITMTSYVASNNNPISGEVNVDILNFESGSTNVIAGTTNTKTGGLSNGITINSGYVDYSIMHQSARVFNMVHELGHAVGLGHTDSYEPPHMGTQVAPLIACNGVANYTDPSSVMKPIISYDEAWTGFTNCDKSVIYYYWG